MLVDQEQKSVNNRQESRRKYERESRSKTGTTHASLSVRVKTEKAQDVRRQLSALKVAIRALNPERKFEENLAVLLGKLEKMIAKHSPTEAVDPEAEAFSTLQKLPQ